MLPLGHVIWPLAGEYSGMKVDGETERMPLSPSIIVLRTSLYVSPTIAIRQPGLSSAISLTHSAPQRVLPKPRPARMSHVVHSPVGGSWLGLAQNFQLYFRLARASGLRLDRSPSLSSSERPARTCA